MHRVGIEPTTQWVQTFRLFTHHTLWKTLNFNSDMIFKEASSFPSVDKCLREEMPKVVEVPAILHFMWRLAGHESRKLARSLKQRQGWQLRIVKRRQRAFKITGLTWIVEHSFAWLGRNRRLLQGLRVSGADLRDDDRPCRNPPHAQPDRPI